MKFYPHQTGGGGRTVLARLNGGGGGVTNGFEVV